MGVSQIANVVYSLFRFYDWLIVIWCFLSWLPIQPGSVFSDIAGAIDALVSPYINLFRRFIPAVGGIDFSPIVAIFVLEFLRGVIVQLLYSIV